MVPQPRLVIHTWSLLRHVNAMLMHPAGAGSEGEAMRSIGSRIENLRAIAGPN